MLTTKALYYLDSKVPGRHIVITGQAWGGTAVDPNGQMIAFSPQGNYIANGSQGVARLWNANTGALLGAVDNTTENFVRIGHSLVALSLAWAGGLLSRSLHARRGPASTAPLPVPSPGSRETESES